MTNPARGPADYLALGDWNAICDRCAGKFKASQLTRTWDGFMVCARDWEPRQPQDFVRGIADPKPVPWTRLEQQPSFVPFCTPNGLTALPGMATPGCVIPGVINPANTEYN